jgi:hypothetical protein
MRRRKISVVIASLALVLASFPTTRAAASTGSATALDPGTAHFGKTFGQWSAAWWQWALSIPVHSPPFSSRVNHPLVDETGSKCGEEQSGPVWFLGGEFFEAGHLPEGPVTVERHACTVPKSKALFFPLLNQECTQLEGPANGCADKDTGNRAAVKSGMDLADNLTADIDGETITISKDLTSQGGNRVDSATKPTFCIDLPPDDLLSFIGEGPGGFDTDPTTHFSPTKDCTAVDDGYYVMLAPLSKGAHVVHFHGEIPSSGFILDVTYGLTVT